ncbi:TonB-dependent receptor domain-containing protein [Rhodothermus marinus]|uniref:TonB-dependent receptor n=1 Tax=Rhodothermus marinus TaxID=29549 RepID=UPI0037C702ED
MQRLFLLIPVLLTAWSVRAQTGRIAGTVVDAETGEPLIGVNVLVVEKATGAATDLEGRYEIADLAPGTYTLRFSYVGYVSQTVEGVVVRAGEVTRIDLSLAPESVGLEAVVVEARLLRNTEAALLAARQRAAAVSDAISAEMIGRTGSSDAADAMEKVTGASVLDGKYVYVRGLGERYMNAQLNGLDLPSADPDRKAVPFDLFPAALLDNIVTVKTFTPDRPGSFTGGSVNLNTRAFPDALSISFSTSITYRPQMVGFGNPILAVPDADPGVWGFRADRLDVPALLKTHRFENIPSLSQAILNPDKARLLDQLSRALTPEMAPVYRRAPLNQSYTLSAGNRFDLGGDRLLGLVASFSYRRQATAYDDGIWARYRLTGRDEAVLSEDNYLHTISGTDEVVWGSLINATLRPHRRHELGFSFIQNHSAESTARYQRGRFLYNLEPDDIYETRALIYIERDIRTYQLRGKHALGDGRQPATLSWDFSTTGTWQDEPDRRFFTNHYRLRTGSDGAVDTLYTIRATTPPQRYFRYLEESNQVGNLALEVPLTTELRLKVGGYLEHKTRTYRERKFVLRQQRGNRYDGDPEAYFAPENLGILQERDLNGDGTPDLFTFGLYLQEDTQPSSNYDGTQDIRAGFAMIDWTPLRRLRVITGLRYETTDMEVVSQDTTKDVGRLRNGDWLPAATVIYRLADDMNLRLAYGRTLARPVFRELAPYSTFEYVGGYLLTGNPALRRTLVDNFDLRWEWFVRPGELLAASLFFKYFDDPIEVVYQPFAPNDSPEVQYRNVEDATLYGLELELRKRLDFLGGALRHFEVGGNATFIHSTVRVPAEELQSIRELRPDAPATRSLQGQSPYLINADLSYVHERRGTTVSLYYNVFGPRLKEVGLGGTPDTYERPRHTLDLNISQRLLTNLSLKLSAKNLLNARYRVSHSYRGREYVTRDYGSGRSFSIGLSYHY